MGEFSEKSAAHLPVDINLCSGAGGLALGLAQAGFTHFDFYDKDQVACDTLRHNFGTASPTLKGRVFEGNLAEVGWLSNTSKPRLLAVGAPCQPFSRGGSHRGPADGRNLFPLVVHAVRALRPQAVLIENVRGLERGDHEPYLEYVVDQLRFPDIALKPRESWSDHALRIRRHALWGKASPIYDVAWNVFNAADFGVAQVRHRLFIVATADGLPEYRFPLPTHSKLRLLQDQLTPGYWEARNLAMPKHPRALPRTSRIQSELLPWATVRDKISDLGEACPQENPDCNNHWTIPGAKAYVGHSGSTLDWPSKTIKAGVHGVPGGENSVICDDDSLRYYTLREMARIQSFPDGHFFTGARSSVIRQVGNAVPCELAAAVAAPLGRILGSITSGTS